MGGGAAARVVRRPSLWFGGGIVAISLILATFVSTITTSNNATSFTADEEAVAATPPSLHGGIYEFDSIDSLVATSDLVVRGEVTDIRAGPIVDGGEARLQQVVLKVQDVLSGHYAASRLAMTNLAWVRDPTAGNGWVEIGKYPGKISEQGYYFLLKAPGSVEGQPHFGIIAPVGRLILSDGSLVGPPGTGERQGSLGSEVGLRLIQKIEALSPAELEARIDRAVERIAAGIVTGESPGGKDPTPEHTGNVVTLAEGRARGGPWKLVAAPTRGGFCYGVGYGHPSANECLKADDVNRLNLLARTTSDPALAIGVISSAVNSVDIRLPDKNGMRATLRRPPPELPDVQFYVVPIDSTNDAGSVEHVAHDKSGKEIARYGGGRNR